MTPVGGAARAPGHHRAERRRQDDAVQPDHGRISRPAAGASSSTGRRSPGSRRTRWRAAASRARSSAPRVSRLPVRESLRLAAAARGRGSYDLLGSVDRLRVPIERARGSRGGGGARRAARRARGRALVRRAAPAGDRDRAGHRPEAPPPRRAHRRHVSRGNAPHDRAPRRAAARDDPAHHRARHGRGASRSPTGSPCSTTARCWPRARPPRSAPTRASTRSIWAGGAATPDTPADEVLTRLAAPASGNASKLTRARRRGDPHLLRREPRPPRRVAARRRGRGGGPSRAERRRQDNADPQHHGVHPAPRRPHRCSRASRSTAGPRTASRGGVWRWCRRAAASSRRSRSARTCCSAPGRPADGWTLERVFDAVPAPPGARSRRRAARSRAASSRCWPSAGALLTNGRVLAPRRAVGGARPARSCARSAASSCRLKAERLSHPAGRAELPPRPPRSPTAST